MKEHIILGCLWLAFGVLHSFLASIKAKNLAAGWMGKNFVYYRIFYTFFAFITFGLVVGYQLSISAVRIYMPSLLTLLSGVVTFGLGLVIMSICIRKYFLSLSGIKSLVKEETTENELMISGIHQYMRHPLYTGTFLAIWGLFILYPLSTLFLANIIITIYTLIAIYWEEEKLELQFGERYRQYKKEVPKLIPFIRY
jgi:methanethiol S-methyltransferase